MQHHVRRLVVLLQIDTVLRLRGYRRQESAGRQLGRRHQQVRLVGDRRLSRQSWFRLLIVAGRARPRNTR